MDRRFAKVAGAVGAGHDHRAGAVGQQAAVAQRERVHDHARGQHVLDGQRTALEGVGVLLRPGASRDGDGGKLGARGAVLRHVPGRRQRIGRHWIARLMRGLVGRLFGSGHHAARAGAHRRAVADQCHVAQPCLKRHRRRDGMAEKARPADIGAVDPARRDAKVFERRDRREGVAHVRAEQPVHLRHRQPGVVQRLTDRQRLDVHRSEAGRLAQPCGADADDGGLPSEGRTHRAASSLGSKTTTCSPSSPSMRAVTAMPM